MTDKWKSIRSDIERNVAHLARVHQVGQDEIWEQMYLEAKERLA